MRHGKRAADRRSPPLARPAGREPEGCTEALLLAHGIRLDLIVDVVRAGLATAKGDRMVAGGRSVGRGDARLRPRGVHRSILFAGTMFPPGVPFLRCGVS
jgi:hypothetical protein